MDLTTALMKNWSSISRRRRPHPYGVLELSHDKNDEGFKFEMSINSYAYDVQIADASMYILTPRLWLMVAASTANQTAPIPMPVAVLTVA